MAIFNSIILHQGRSKMTVQLHLTLKDNNIKCQCNDEAIKFLAWFQDTKVILPEDNYSCSLLEAYTFLKRITIKDFKQTCNPSKIPIVFMSVFGTLVIVLIILALILLNRYKWRIQYRLQNCLRFTWNANTSLELQEGFFYDAFISYCAEDRFWVHDSLMKRLESGKYGLKLCIHYQDFPLG